MRAFRPRCLATAIGSLPHADPKEACALVLRELHKVPIWPQLPKRSQFENMYVQYFERFPGATVVGGKVLVDRGSRLESDLEVLYADYLEGRTASYGLDARVAAGFSEMLGLLAGLAKKPIAVKGHVTGPVSAGLQITDRELRPILYDDVLSDALGKFLRLSAMEQERALREVCDTTIMFLDEPFLSAVGSGFIQVRREQVVELLSEVLGGLRGLKGVHCCANTDWSLVTAAPIDVLSFDAYDHAATLALYGDEVKAFLRRGGSLAWGIVPTDPRLLDVEDAASLTERLLAAVDRLASRGIDREEILERSWVTPSCGLGSLTTTAAERALSLTVEIAERMCGRFFAKRW